MRRSDYYKPLHSKSVASTTIQSNSVEIARQGSTSSADSKHVIDLYDIVDSDDDVWKPTMPGTDNSLVPPQSSNSSSIEVIQFKSTSISSASSQPSIKEDEEEIIAEDERYIHEANKIIFGNKRFRPFQLDIIRSILRNEDAFVIMPTGGGKSLCYALPAVLSKGVSVVVSPLISLIEDQVSGFIQLPSGGIPSAYLTSNCTEGMAKSVIADLKRGRKGLEPFIKLLYLTPERIAKGQATRAILNELYQNEMLARFVIDEAHCVSHWGHDFRKDYAELKILKNEFPEVPIVALTATARKKVADDTIKILQIPHCRRFNTGTEQHLLLNNILIILSRR